MLRIEPPLLAAPAPEQRSTRLERARYAAAKEAACSTASLSIRTSWGGRACIRGLRIAVSVIVGQIAHGASVDEILEGYPDLEREDVQQAIEYAAWLAQEQVHSS
jgi:uncharacterized protein (DUF433 family)